MNSNITYHELLAEYRLIGDDGDGYGTCMKWFFAVANELDRRNLICPDHWQYRPSPFGPEKPEDYEQEICSQATEKALIAFGNMLERYYRLLKAAGMDY